MAKIDKFVKFVKMGCCATISPMVVASSPRGAAKRALCRVHDIKRSPDSPLEVTPLKTQGEFVPLSYRRSTSRSQL